VGGAGRAARPSRTPSGAARTRARDHGWSRGREGVERRSRRIAQQARAEVWSHVCRLQKGPRARVLRGACANA
jgi:hypothetical protein